jgi:hypothetical protein
VLGLAVGCHSEPAQPDPDKVKQEREQLRSLRAKEQQEVGKVKD